jgi:F-type H+-transporting ATPase subunit delta
MAQFDQELRIADVYAEALFELAGEAGRVAEVRAELDELLKLWRTEPEFEKFMVSPALEAEGRAAGLERMLRNRLSDMVLNTLLVMGQHGRCGLLPALHRRYVLRQEEAANEIEVKVASAVELSKQQRAEAVEIAARASGKTPVVEYVVDPDVLGGLIVQVGELRMDNSLRRHLRVARGQLLERAERGLEAGAGGHGRMANGE